MTAQDSKLSADEIALYDRQIRLWGIDAQARIRSSKILLVNLSSAGVEIAKNLMLSGIGELTILDDGILTEEDLDTNFYVNSRSVGEYKLKASYDKIKELNSRVELVIDIEPILSKDDFFFQKFDLVVVTELNKSDILKINEITRTYKIPFYSTGLHGLYGYIFVDLLSYVADTKTQITSSLTKKIGKIDSVRELISTQQTRENDQLVEINKIKNIYKPFNEIGNNDTIAKFKEFFNTKRKLKKISIILPCILALINEYDLNNHTIDDINITFEEFEPKLELILQKMDLNININKEEVENFLNQAYTQFQPTGAIIGGAISQDIIQYLSQKQCFNNFVVLDAVESKMPIYTI